VKTIAVDDFIKALSFKQKCIDVRAPIEFSQGAIPGSVNIPLLNDKERAIVGTCYKQNGQAAAIKLGHKIVSGENKSLKINQWKDFLIQNPKTIITCFRGGLRSQTTQIFLKEIGFEVLRLDGGYKKIRQTYLDKINEILNDDNKSFYNYLNDENKEYFTQNYPTSVYNAISHNYKKSFTEFFKDFNVKIKNNK
jgi:tRNA 2-selenouridine synthase